MSASTDNPLPLEFLAKDQVEALQTLAMRRNWGWAILLVAWLHLLAFLACYYLTIVQNYHEALGYLSIWTGELCGMWLIFRLCGGQRLSDAPSTPLEVFIRRVWIAYFLLAFNLGTMNAIRGHALFELFPATASLASFAFIIMSVVVSWRFFGAVLVMFASGLLMAGNLIHEFLIFAISWWLVLNCIGVVLLLQRTRTMALLAEKTSSKAASPILTKS